METIDLSKFEPQETLNHPSNLFIPATILSKVFLQKCRTVLDSTTVVGDILIF